MAIQVPVEKMEDLRQNIGQFLSKEKTTLRQIQSLIGSLSFACKAIPVGRPFLRRLIDLTVGVVEFSHKSRIFCIMALFYVHNVVSSY
jgi:hypothetical protein